MQLAGVSKVSAAYSVREVSLYCQRPNRSEVRGSSSLSQNQHLGRSLQPQIYGKKCPDLKKLLSQQRVTLVLREALWSCDLGGRIPSHQVHSLTLFLYHRPHRFRIHNEDPLARSPFLFLFFKRKKKQKFILAIAL